VSTSASVDDRLVEFGRQWRNKPALRAIYHDLYRRMAAELAAGPTLEIGGGSGGFKEFAPDVTATDILAAPWLDLVADAQALPFSDASFSNIVMFDVLHHIEFPRRFFQEALRVLAPGGRVIMVEPAITPLSWPFYRFLHAEPMDLDADPLHDGVPLADRDPFAANQAVPTLLVGTHRPALAAAFPQYKIKPPTWLSLFAYPLSGGFKPWSLIPHGLVTPLLKLEDALLPVVGRWMAFRLMLVLEKRRS
jgi:SAM-dependent methyltransferase